MPKVNISKETHARLVAFQPVVAALMDEEFSIDESADMLIRAAMATTLSNLWGSQDAQALLLSLQGIADKHPKEVFDFVAGALAAGGRIEREQARDKFGFRPPEKPDAADQ